MQDVRELERELDSILAILRERTGVARTTLRMDDPQRGWQVDFICAEALAPGAKSLRGEGGINQRAAETVKWLSNEKRNLIQPDLLNNPNPPAPPALIAIYNATAQMLGPILDKDQYLVGWISAHGTDGPRKFSDEDIRALDHARAEVARALELDA